jgi:hypothetical protein
MTFPTRFQSSCALLVLVCSVSHANASLLRGSANPANDTGVDTPGRMLEPNNGFPFPRYDNGCLPNEFKDKCESCMCLEGGIGNPVQTKRCNIEAIPDGSGNNGCYDKMENGEQCLHGWDCISTVCLQLAWEVATCGGV